MLVPLMAISMAAAMWGLSGYLTAFFQRRAELETDRLGHAVQLALRQSMLHAPDVPLNNTLQDVERTPEVQRVWIIDKEGRIAHAADPAMVGRVLDKRQDAVCKLCHGNVTGAAPQTVFIRDEGGVAILRHVRPIVNEKSCWGCHDAKARFNGILLLDESAQPFQAALSTIQVRLGATGGITLLVIASMTLIVTTVLVQRPARRLIAGARQLGTGDLAARVPVRGGDELAELAGSFNLMAGDLERGIEEIRNKNAELTVVYTIVERLTKTIELGDLKEIILKTLADIFEADQVLLLSHMNQQDMRETLIRSRGVTRLYRNTHSNQDGWYLPDAIPTPVAEHWLAGELQAPLVTEDRRMSVVPVGFGGKPLLLVLIKRERPFAHAEANPKLLSALSNHIGVAFENARLYTMAITDAMTRLFSRCHFQNRVADAVSNYELGGQPFGLVILDLDNFKEVNDRFGHPAGDTVLQQAARALMRSIRVGDSAYRYGGEEFAILLPGADAAVSLAVAERARQAIADLRVHLSHGVTATITASAGVAVCPQDGKSVQEVVAAADAALYRSKDEGRNRVTVSQDSAR